ncbi:MAG: hypothetical protein QG567_1498 [Campylobacterota bacterium]|nr:hypothetical protein [Campylobacterota bacterium]MDQ1340341.1 hypothetical protein [Campylobacterota bacterium]
MIEDIYNSCFTREYKTSTSLQDFNIIFQFQIEKKDSSGGSDSFLNIETKLGRPDVTDEFKKRIQEFKDRSELNDNQAEYNVIIDGDEHGKQTLLMIFGLIFSIFLVVENLACIVVDESMDIEQERLDLKLKVESENSHRDYQN